MPPIAERRRQAFPQEVVRDRVVYARRDVHLGRDHHHRSAEAARRDSDDVNFRLLMVTVVPMTASVPPRRCHRPWLTIVTGMFAPGRSSSTVNARPRAIATPNVSK